MKMHFAILATIGVLSLSLGCSSSPSTRGLKLKKYFAKKDTGPSGQERSAVGDKSKSGDRCDRDPLKWGVVVGVNDYKNDSITDLKGAVVDAWSFYHYLTSPHGGQIPRERVTLLLNKSATRANVEGAFGNLRACAQDQVFLYFAGHGSPEPDAPENAFLLVHDSDPANMVGTAISMHKLPDFLSWRVGQAGNLLMIIDACHAGNIQFKSTRGLKLNKPKDQKQIEKEAASRVKGVNASLEKMSQGQKGWGTLSATATDQLAEEATDQNCIIDGQKYNGGVFTCRLLEALSGEADQDGDEALNLSELHSYLKTTVTEDTNGKQLPQLSGSLELHLPLMKAPQQPIMIPEVPEYYKVTYVEKNNIKPYRNTSLITSGLGLATGLIFQSLTNFTHEEMVNFQGANKTTQDYRSLESTFDFQRGTSMVGYGTAILTGLLGSGLWAYEVQAMKPDLEYVYYRDPWFKLKPTRGGTRGGAIKKKVDDPSQKDETTSTTQMDTAE